MYNKTRKHTYNAQHDRQHDAQHDTHNMTHNMTHNINTQHDMSLWVSMQQHKKYFSKTNYLIITLKICTHSANSKKQSQITTPKGVILDTYMKVNIC